MGKIGWKILNVHMGEGEGGASTGLRNSPKFYPFFYYFSNFNFGCGICMEIL